METRTKQHVSIQGYPEATSGIGAVLLISKISENSCYKSPKKEVNRFDPGRFEKVMDAFSVIVPSTVST